MGFHFMKIGAGMLGSNDYLLIEGSYNIVFYNYKHKYIF